MVVVFVNFYNSSPRNIPTNLAHSCRKIYQSCLFREVIQTNPAHSYRKPIRPTNPACSPTKFRPIPHTPMQVGPIFLNLITYHQLCSQIIRELALIWCKHSQPCFLFHSVSLSLTEQAELLWEKNRITYHT